MDSDLDALEFRIVDIEFPEKTSSRDQLLELHLEGTAIRGLPASIELLSGNVLLNLKDCKNLKSLPSTINGLRLLRTLYLSGCSKLKNVPETLGKVESLEAKMQNDFDYVEQSAVETVTKLAKAESLSTVLLLCALLSISSTERFRFMEEEC
ncbi:hypothetical protein CUMW_233710 [Citrus unshiu]|uniref:NB-ARC domain-containing protein n=1 Tax=Citrus unshiu TaxID=55188 RepID=A0A2H5QIK1_CITUN|nr:hypothetical protein CUMW_233710 [Citrus unshiu]